MIIIPGIVEMDDIELYIWAISLKLPTVITRPSLAFSKSKKA